MLFRRLMAGLLVLGVLAGLAVPSNAQDKDKGKDKKNEGKGGDKGGDKPSGGDGEDGVEHGVYRMRGVMLHAKVSALAGEERCTGALLASALGDGLAPAGRLGSDTEAAS